ncbi:hypothetical protein GGR54DRAFT_28915 [Hypoxylon sp. NC1633]|nr:hypothetical protein GGR54DRAFT_28915 [Hypoxylon sp. NC1633]
MEARTFFVDWTKETSGGCRCCFVPHPSAQTRQTTKHKYFFFVFVGFYVDGGGAFMATHTSMRSRKNPGGRDDCCIAEMRAISERKLDSGNTERTGFHASLDVEVSPKPREKNCRCWLQRERKGRLLLARSSRWGKFLFLCRVFLFLFCPPALPEYRNRNRNRRVGSVASCMSSPIVERQWTDA